MVTMSKLKTASKSFYGHKGAVDVRPSFSDGLRLGLGAASLFLAGGLVAPRAPQASIKSDWDAIGRDLWKAIAARDVKPKS